jgi:hypothetical protein
VGVIICAVKNSAALGVGAKRLAGRISPDDGVAGMRTSSFSKAALLNLRSWIWPFYYVG